MPESFNYFVNANDSPGQTGSILAITRLLYEFVWILKPYVRIEGYLVVCGEQANRMESVTRGKIRQQREKFSYFQDYEKAYSALKYAMVHKLN